MTVRICDECKEKLSEMDYDDILKIDRHYYKLCNTMIWGCVLDDHIFDDYEFKTLRRDVTVLERND